MSPNVNSFVHDLVAMAQAMDRLPQVEADLDRANTAIEDYAKQVQRLEMSLIERKAEIDRLNDAVRHAEVARDDAELRFLEAEDGMDKVSKALAMARSALDEADHAIAMTKPKVPEPVVEAPPEPVYPWTITKFDDGGPYNEQPGQSVTLPYSDQTSQDSAPTVPASATPNDAGSAPAPVEVAGTIGQVEGGGEASQGQSVSHPIAPVQSIETGENVLSSGAKTEESVSQPTTINSSGAEADPEPTQRFANGDVTPAWWDWYDRQSLDFRQSYRF